MNLPVYPKAPVTASMRASPSRRQYWDVPATPLPCFRVGALMPADRHRSLPVPIPIATARIRMRANDVGRRQDARKHMLTSARRSHTFVVPGWSLESVTLLNCSNARSRMVGRERGVARSGTPRTCSCAFRRLNALTM